MSGMFSHITPHKRALSYHLDRQNVLASNIANLDTPGYISKDLTNEGIVEEDMFAKVMQRHNLDIEDTGFDGEEREPKIFDDPSPTPGNDGNAVDLDREMSKVAANSSAMKPSPPW